MWIVNTQINGYLRVQLRCFVANLNIEEVTRFSVIDESQKRPIEKRKRTLKTISPILRGEREIWISFPQFWEEKEKSEKIFSTLEKRNRKVNSLLKLREKKEKSNKIKSIYERRKRNLKFYSLISRVEREKWNSPPSPHFFIHNNTKAGSYWFSTWEVVDYRSQCDTQNTILK